MHPHARPATTRGTSPATLPVAALAALAALIAAAQAGCAADAGADADAGAGVARPRTTLNRYFIRVHVDPRGRARSNSPVSVEVDFQQALARQGDAGTFDESTVEVVAVDPSGRPRE